MGLNQNYYYVDDRKPLKHFNNIFLRGITLGRVKLFYDSFDINPDLSFEEQKFSFTQDILQLGLNNYTVDVGYYPDFDPNGFFKIVVIKDFDWMNPVYEKKTKSIYEMRTYLQDAINFTNTIVKTS